MRPYIVHAPYPYSARSGGVRALYGLARGLLERGQTVAIASLGPTPWPTDPIDPIPMAYEWGATARADAIHVYPEIVQGNPAHAERVVRWMLGPKRYDSGDLEFVWSPELVRGAPRLAVDIIEADLFYPKTSPGHGVLWWGGKGSHLVVRDAIPEGAREITHEWPENRSALADALRGAELLISFDSFSAINTESTICGTPVFLHPASEALPQPPMELYGRLGFTRRHRETINAQRECLSAAAVHHDLVRHEIARDIDRFIEITTARFGG